MNVSDEPMEIKTYRYGIAISSMELCDILYEFMKKHSYYSVQIEQQFVDKVFLNNKIVIDINPNKEEIKFSFK